MKYICLLQKPLAALILRQMGRDPKHDYRSRCIYHITIGKARCCPDFSCIKGSLECPVVERSPIGHIIESQILNLPFLCPSLRVIQYVIMPDHIHFAVFAQEYLPKAIGSYIGMMKVRCKQLVNEEFTSVKAVFTEDFHDRYLRPVHNLNIIMEYIRQNPYRLLARRLNPNFFRRKTDINIRGSLWQAYGNIQLLENPFKAPVIIHRSDSESQCNEKYRRWKHLAENGGVIVSAFISSKEKAVRVLCERLNAKMILLTHKPLGPRNTPGAHDFEMCLRGHMLILAPMTEIPPGRGTFLYLNSIAEYIASSPFMT